MEKLQRRSQSKDDVPVELIHRIQSLLPLKEANRTCVLSKLWLRAWSTIPQLRFNKTSDFSTEEKQRDYIKLIDRTVFRYVQQNIPIESFDLILDIKSVSHANNWIRTLASQSCLKEIFIRICNKSDGKIILPDEIFSGKNLHTLSVSRYLFSSIGIVSVSCSPTINCVNLRVLYLEDVKISEKLLDTLFSICTLLEKINLSYCNDLTTIKVRNLSYLQQLGLKSETPFDILKIEDVPNLCSFSYLHGFNNKPITFNMASLRIVTELFLNGVIIDFAFLDMIKSKLLVLEILNLVISDCTMEWLFFTSFSLKRLTLTIRESCRINDIQVCAPKLHYLHYNGKTMPILQFPSSNVPEYFKLTLHFEDPIDHSFILRIRELLNLSTKFDIKITYSFGKLRNIDVNDLQIRFPIPATNVQQLSFYTLQKYLGREQLLFDTLLSICHPNYITLYCPKEYGPKYEDNPTKFSLEFFELMISAIIAKKTSNLKEIEFKNPGNGKWQVLTNSWASVIDTSDDSWLYSVELKPNW